MQSRFLNFDFGKLHYLQGGKANGPTIVFLHGTASTAASYADLEPILGDQFNLIALDFPGHGQSDHIDVARFGFQYSMIGLRTLFEEFRHRLSLHEIIAVGNSVGANIATQSLFKDPNLLGLVSIAGVHAVSREDAFSNFRPEAPKELAFKNHLVGDEADALTRAYLDVSQAGTDVYKRMLSDIKESDGNFSEQFAIHLKTQGWLDELAILSGSKVPFLYIGGKNDAFIDNAYYDKLQARVPRIQPANVHILEDVGHVPHLEAPEVCGKLILEFSKTL